jgi:hypothetical protein
VWLTNILGAPAAFTATLQVGSTETVLEDVAYDATSGHMKFSVATQPGSTYYIEYKENLEAPTWLPLQTIVGDGTVKFINDPVLPPPSQRFYRVRIE